MPLRIKCPSGHTLIVPDDRAGRTLQCPRCDQPVVVPVGEPDAFGSALLGVLAEGIHGSTRDIRRINDERPSPGAVTLDRPASAESPSTAGPSRQAKSSRDSSVRAKGRALPLGVSPPGAPSMPAPPTPTPIAERPRPDPYVLQPIAPSEPAPPEAIPNAPFDKPVAVEPPPAPEVKVETPAEQPAVGHVEVAVPRPFSAGDSKLEAPPASAELAAPPRFFAPQFVPHDRKRDAFSHSLQSDVSRTIGAYQLAAALAAAALFSVMPAVWDVVEYLQFAESAFVARWALALFFLGVVQLAYAVYLFQLPDWTTVWVVTLFSLFVAAVYAAVLALVLLSPADGLLIGPHGLQLADKLAGGKAALWCLCMVSLATTLAFFAGRQSAAWYKAERMLRIYSPGG